VVLLLPRAAKRHVTQLSAQLDAFFFLLFQSLSLWRRGNCLAILYFWLQNPVVGACTEGSTQAFGPEKPDRLVYTNEVSKPASYDAGFSSGLSRNLCHGDGPCNVSWGQAPMYAAYGQPLN